MSESRVPGHNIYNELTVYGYVRNERKDKILIFPDDIINVILEFFKNIFEWRHEWSIGYEFYDYDFSKATRIEDNNEWSFLVTKDFISNEYCKAFEFEITINEILGPDVNFMFGFVEHPISISIQTWAGSCNWFARNSTNSKQFGVSVIGKYDYFRLSGPNKSLSEVQTSLPRQLLANYKINDRFGLKINFKTKECSLYFNDKFVSVIYKNIPNQIVPAVNVYGKKPMTFSCTKWILNN